MLHSEMVDLIGRNVAISLICPVNEFYNTVSFGVLRFAFIQDNIP